jgi:hypothetical protein
MKKILAMLLALAMVFALVACGNPGSEQPSGDPKPGTDPAPGSSEPAGPTYEDMGTIMWLSNLSSGAQYDAAVAYLTALCDALGYEFTVVYGDPFNDAAGNLTAVTNGMTDDVVGLIASQDGGLNAIMEEYPDLWVAGYNTDMVSVYGGGENASCLENPKFLGSMADGFVDGYEMGENYFERLLTAGYKKIAIVNFPAFAYPNQGEADVAIRELVAEYNKTADEPIEIVGETTTLMFEPLPDSWFLEEGRSDLDGIVALCAGQLFVYPTMVSAKANGTCAADTKMITGGFEADPSLTADIGEGRTISSIGISPMEACAYALVLIDNAVTGNQFADHTNACQNSGSYLIDSIKNIDDVMSKTLLGTADPALAQISVEDMVALCGRSNPNNTLAGLLEAIQTLTPDTLN